jgi:hypothetical protein
MCSCIRIIVYFRTYAQNKRRPFTNLLSKNIVPFEMSDGVGKTSRAINFQVIFLFIFSGLWSSILHKPGFSLCALAEAFTTQTLWILSDMCQSAISLHPKESKHFAARPCVDAYMFVYTTHVFSSFRHVNTRPLFIFHIYIHVTTLNTAWTLNPRMKVKIYCFKDSRLINMLKIQELFLWDRIFTGDQPFRL